MASTNKPYESGWLIELRGNPPFWWAGRECWVINAAEALRFARKVDAERARLHFIPEDVRDHCFCSEHAWELSL